MKIHYAEAIYDEKERDAVLAAFDSGWFSGGKFTDQFEKKLADWWGVKYALSCNSGSSANFIATQALFDEGDEIITMALGFPTTVSALVYNKLKPVFVDCDLDSMTINTKALESAITHKTKGLMFAHTLGNVANMGEVMRIVEDNNLILLEDCCDAIGSTWKDKKVGTFGKAATVSFYPAHHMTTFGEGGAILTNDYGIYKKARSIRDWGRACWCKFGQDDVCGRRFDNPPFDHKYYYTNLGMNLKMIEAQAAFGLIQLDRLDNFIKARKANYKCLLEGITHPDIKIADHHPDADVSWFCLPLISKTHKKEYWMRKLEDKGIQTRAVFAGNLTKHPAYKGIGEIRGDLDNTNRIMTHAFFVGLHPGMSIKDLNYTAKIINEI